MNEIDFQNGLVAGLMIAGKNGVAGGVKQPPAAGGFFVGFLEAISLYSLPNFALSYSPLPSVTAIEHPA